MRQNKGTAQRAKALDTRSIDRGRQVIRLLTIVRALDNARRGLTVQELHTLLEERCTLRTVYRDLDQLQQAGFTLVEQDGRYALSELSRGLQATPLRPHEVLCLLLSGSMLEPLAPTALGAAHRDLQERLLAGLTAEGRRFVTEQRAALRATHPTPTTLSTPPSALAAVEDAHDKEQCLRITYAAPNKAPTERVVEPHLLWMHAGRPYVVAFCHEAQDFRSFALQRITAATVLDEPFERRADFDAKAFTERGFGVHHGDVHSFVICFGPAVAYLAHERRWHRTQELETLSDNCVLLRFTASGLPEVAAWVASFGGAVRAVEPSELVEAVQRIHAEGLRAHGAEVTATPERASTLTLDATLSGAVRSRDAARSIPPIKAKPAVSSTPTESNRGEEETNPTNSSRRRKKSPSKEPLTSIVNDRWHGGSTGE